MRINFFSKALLFGLLFSLYTHTLFSQTYSNKASSIFSFTVGMTSTSLLNDSIDYKSGIMFNGGFAYSVMLNNRLNIALEALHTGKGIKTESPIVKYRYFYVDLPLYAQIKVSESFRINAGVQYSIATNSQMISIDNTKTNGVRVDAISAIKPTDYGFLAGIDFDVSKSISLGARYTVSGSLLFEKHGTNFGVFQLSVKYSPIKTYQVFFHREKAQQ